MASKLAALEMAQNGTTCFLEAGGVMETDAAATAIEEIGIRGLLGDAFVRDIGDSGASTVQQDPDRAFRVLGSELKRNQDPETLVRGVVTISGLGTASDELVLAAKSLADRNGVVFSQHQSYQRQDADADDRRLGRHPLVHYPEIGALAENCTFSHMNVLRDDEVEPVVKSGMSVVWCPMASMLYGVGGTIRGRHAELLKMGASVALGCDSASWTSAFDIGEQGFIALLSAREKMGSTDALVAEDVLQMATLNGARAVGLADRLGSLEVGKRADLVIRRQDLPEAHPGLDPIRSVVYSSRSKSVDTVIVNGQVIIENGHSTRIDEQDLFASSHGIARELLERLDRGLPAGRWPLIE